jgi:hypothetical protein
VFCSIVVGTDGSDTAQKAVDAAVELARLSGAQLEIVSAYEPVSRARLRDEKRQVPADLQWMVNPREEVDATLADAAERVAESGVEPRTYAREGDPRRRGGARLGPDRRWQQGHDRSEALPARIGAEQGHAPRALLRDDHPDDVAGAAVAARASISPAP